MTPSAPRAPWGAPPPAPAWFVPLALFASGACSLVLEIVGARLVAPMHGSSIYVWSSMITTTLVALAAGYAWGGRLADRHPSLTAFSRLLTAAGLTLAAVPWLRRPVLMASSGLGARAGSLACAAVLLGPSLLLLGALGPSAARLSASGAHEVGRRSGDAWAVSTAGSVLGAAAAGFWLIPSYPLSGILLGCAAVLLALGALGSWLSARRAPAAALAACAACLALSLRPEPEPGAPVLFRRQSAYGRIAVVESDGLREFLVDGTSQSALDTAAGESACEYVLAFEWAAAARPRARKALVVGLGGGSLPLGLARAGVPEVDVAELDPAVAQAARDWFGFAPSGRLLLGDGRGALASGRRWDLVFLDAFGAESPPGHLFTREAFRAARTAMPEDGVLAVNLVASVDGSDPRAWLAVRRALGEAFPVVRTFVASEPADGLANVLFFASAAPIEAPASRLRPAARPFARAMLARELSPAPEELAAAEPLTDERGALEALLARSALRWRRLVREAMPPELLL